MGKTIANMKPTHIAIAVLVIYAILMTTCNGCLVERLKDAECTLVDSIVYRDTGSVKFTEVPIVQYVTTPGTTDTIRDTFLIPSQTDTAAILADYFRTRHYFNQWDTLDVSVALKEAVTANRIESRELTIQNNRATKIEQVFENPPKPLVLIGGFAQGNGEVFDFGPWALFQTKKDFTVGYQYEVVGKTHEVGAAIPIRF